MQNQKTQQFAKFFLKDLKIKNPKQFNEKSDPEALSLSTSS